MSCYRRVIRITGDDSPNVRLAKAQIAAGLEPTGEVLVPGVLPWADYCRRRAAWDAQRQCVGLDAQFYEGREQMLYPADWLSTAGQLRASGRAVAIGVDPGEGGSETAMAVTARDGLLEMEAQRTPDTDMIVGWVLAAAKRHGVVAENVIFDRGGGGKQHADRMRAMGFNVRTVAFGEAWMMEPQHGIVTIRQQTQHREMRYSYVNRRAQMYGELRELLEHGSYAIPAAEHELRRQLAPIPLTFDKEGRLKLLPKSGKKGEPCLTAMLGCSPDRADALVLAVHGMLHKRRHVRVGVV